MFQLTGREADALRFQSGSSKEGRGGRRYLPYVFTQEGVAMLSGVLHSPRAVAVNVAIMRAFVRLRQMALSVEELARRVSTIVSVKEAPLDDADFQVPADYTPQP